MKNDLRKFTLIELLVVVAIIGILVSMLLPSLARARAIATFAVCKSNSKQIALGFVMYANDNAGWVAPPHQGPLATNLVWTEHTIFPKYIDSQAVFKCPADSTPKSYGPNGGATYKTGLVNYGESLMQFSKVENDTYLLLEKRDASMTLESGFPDVAIFQSWENAHWAKSSTWHTGAISYTFVDGHVEGLKIPQRENFTPFED